MNEQQEPCPQAWPVGVTQGIDVPCVREVGHRGWHTNDVHDLKWSGRLNARERKALSRLRGES